MGSPSFILTAYGAVVLLAAIVGRIRGNRLVATIERTSGEMAR